MADTQAIKQAMQRWDAIPMSAMHAFSYAAARSLVGKDATEYVAELAREMGSAAARGDDVGARNIKAMIVACY
jgi:hypothetical protein